MSSIVARGYGSFGGGVHAVPTRGYGVGSPPPTPVGPGARMVQLYVYEPGWKKQAIYVPGFKEVKVA